MYRKQAVRVFCVFCIAAVLLYLLSGLYVVREGEQTAVLPPGLHFHWLLWQKVQKVDVRLQGLVVQDIPVVTSERKTLSAQAYVVWRIQDVATFFAHTRGDVSVVQNKLRQAVRAYVAEQNSEISSIMNTDILVQRMNAALSSLGIAIVDVRMYKLSVPAVSQAAFLQQMQWQLQQVVKRIREDGDGQAKTIRSQANEQAMEIAEKAKEQVSKLDVDAEKQLVKIYADAYQQDPVFYRFYHKLQVYHILLNSKKAAWMLRGDNRWLHGLDEMSN